jgi:hypothetical protein
MNLVSDWRKRVVFAYIDEPPFATPLSNGAARGCDIDLALTGLHAIGLAFDFLDQTADQIVKQRNMIVGVCIGANKEEVGYLAQNREPLGARPLRQRRLQFNE